MAASLDDLAAFACVARWRSFTRAAAELGTSTSNLSHTVRRLEQRLGLRLLNRSSRSVVPSPAGEALLATLGPALAGIDEALTQVREAHAGVGGTLRITATREAYAAVIRPVLAGFTADHPEVTLEVVLDYGFRDLVADRYDAGIRLGEKLQPGVIAVPVGPPLRMAVVATPDHFARHGLPRPPEDLLRHRCINYRMMSSGALYAWEFEREGRALALRLGGPLTFNEPAPMLDAALAGLGVAYLLEDQVSEALAAGTLQRALAEWTPPFPGFHLYYRSKRQKRPVLSAFIERVRRPAPPSPD